MTAESGPGQWQAAVDAALRAAPAWRELSYNARAAVLLKAADLPSGPWRDTLNAATMLGQSKTVFQAEIDSAWPSRPMRRHNTQGVPLRYHFARFAAAAATTVALIGASVALSQPAQADPGDALYYATHWPGYEYDACQFAWLNYGYVTGTVFCAFGVSTSPQPGG